MREQLKEMINKQVSAMLQNWTIRIQQIPSEQQAQTERLMKFIRVLIEFCIEVKQPLYLFSDLLNKFEEHKQNRALCDELRNYILAGIYAELNIKETILG